ncbi:MAG: uroporphyrinogen decarboxylase family protein [Candidatus Fimivivens sp.]|nr:uroporphyrinogen decarboxylase family protein [Candidatus Fimivivens sp.]
MNREERIKAALNSQEVDRVPISVWMHFSEFDQDPRSLAECMVNFNEKYDYDFIKMMPFGAYSTPDWGAKLDIYCDKYKEVVISAPGINSIEDYYRIEPLPPIFGTWGKQLLLSQHMSRIVKPHTPYIQTIFTPATTLRKLAGDRLIQDMKEHPEAVHNALEAITRTTIDFIKANIEAGVSGFFLASQCATYDYMTDELFAEFCKPYEFRVINSYKDVTYFNVMHIHGSNIMFDTLLSYPVNCINWHDRHTAPDLKTARAKTSKTFLGGILEVPTIIKGVLQYDSILQRSTPEEINVHIKEAIDMVDGRGLIIGPGCVADPRSPEANLAAVRAAVENRYQMA